MASPVRCIKSETCENEIITDGASSSSDRLSPEAIQPELPSKIVHYEAGNASKILSGLEGGELLSDIDLRTPDGSSIPAHKAILSASSSFFRRRIEESPEIKSLDLTDCPGQAVRDLIGFLYTSRLSITAEGAKELLSTAVRLELASAQQAVENFLKLRLTVPIVLQTLKRSRGATSTVLLDEARAFAFSRFTEITSDPEFLTLPVKEVEHLISSNLLSIESEEEVYEAAIKWVKADPERGVDGALLYRLLQHVRLPLAKPQFLLDVVQKEPLIKQSSECQQLLEEATRYHMLADQRPLMQSTRTQKRQKPKRSYCKEVIALIGGLNRDKQQISDCFVFRPPTKQLPLASNNNSDAFVIRPERLSSPNVAHVMYCVAKVKNLAVASGGLSQHSACDEVHAFIPSLDLWQQMAPMKQARYLHASAEVDGLLYVAGGLVNNKTRLSSVERWIPDANEWEDVVSLPIPISSSCLVGCDGKLFIIGGATTGDVPVSKVFSFDPSSEEWTPCPDLPEPERGASAVSNAGIIYVVGHAGRVYAFNTQLNQWSRLKDTNGGHVHGAATIYKGKIYVAGGLHGNEYINRTVEMYDPKTSTWSNIAILPTPIYGHGLITLTRET
ncbi:Oidioi.mRNA.OKI2018_I69.chr1.g2029.t1.cds [Oikopleura dioica]|uniref:Oidioi.mRNA.OKI2018_I69.chr1.g2029.t1.cds n=1 Tax=Oikopleura dioica TaxID=34765 RepID=A0ABN7SWR3_OIKDI|nr:Oidioi.mRNA.OKI2018_I69.chr1.g2029.t1.cds [Oikopleura dioica]